ncbi:g9758 [Coccomyxa viridis]|uniref:G9758 protein n=1 Tax=Coccomyxa viridis TaxID=1274662 RepID=A0ABP1G691_9CHLO
MVLLASRSCTLPRPFRSSSRFTRLSCHHIVRSSASSNQVSTPTRRNAVATAAGALLLLTGSRAHAFLGIGEPSKEDVYKADTAKIVDEVRKAIALDKSDPGKEEAMENVRQGTNNWVAKYRRAGVTGRPSYGNTYTALNALAGHFNSFGTTAPLPKKRLERINKELDDATKMLGRGR